MDQVASWPNGLGWDIGPHEIWKLADGYWGVRTSDGDPKHLRVHPTSGRLFPMTLQEAMALCLRDGTPCD